MEDLQGLLEKINRDGIEKADAEAKKIIDAGVTLDWMNDEAIDLRGKRRIMGEAPDLGCYENPQLGAAVIVR